MINKIQLNGKSVNFSAKLQIEGAYRDLPKNVISQLEYLSKRIGNSSDDIICIDIGKKSEKTRELGKKACRYLVTDFYRDNYIFSFINGELIHEKFISNANGGYKKDMRNLSDKIYRYFRAFMKY